jgi:hypothetical protein
VGTHAQQSWLPPSNNQSFVSNVGEETTAATVFNSSVTPPTSKLYTSQALYQADPAVWSGSALDSSDTWSSFFGITNNIPSATANLWTGPYQTSITDPVVQGLPWKSNDQTFTYAKGNVLQRQITASNARDWNAPLNATSNISIYAWLSDPFSPAGLGPVQAGPLGGGGTLALTQGTAVGAGQFYNVSENASTGGIKGVADLDTVGATSPQSLTAFLLYRTGLQRIIGNLFSTSQPTIVTSNVDMFGAYVPPGPTPGGPCDLTHPCPSGLECLDQSGITCGSFAGQVCTCQT